jgi:hypothetical protein
VVLGTAGNDRFHVNSPSGDWTIYGRGGNDTLDMGNYFRNEVTLMETGPADVMVHLSRSTIFAHDLAGIGFSDGFWSASSSWFGHMSVNDELFAIEYRLALGHGPDAAGLHKWEDFSEYQMKGLAEAQAQLGQDLVVRPEFKALYGGMTNDQFFDAVSIAAVGHTLPDQKASWITTLNSKGTEGRGELLAWLDNRPHTYSHSSPSDFVGGIRLA